MPTLEDAIILAAEKHRLQRDLGGEPYILHPLAVMLKMSTEPERMAAVLHDVAEDTDVTLSDLRDMGYSAEVIDAVDCLTKSREDTEPKPDKDQRYESFIERVATNPIARRVKLADLSENMDVKRIKEFGDDDANRMKRYHAAYRRLSAINR
jgi:(p)ppGpp synthase/HD superfamily hydrolase